MHGFAITIKKYSPMATGSDGMDMQSLMSESSRCADLLRCAYNLGEQELELYRFLGGGQAMRSDDIAVSLGRNPSSIYRSLQKLLSCHMVNRRTVNMEGGGYYHLYSARGAQAVKKDLEACVGEWKSRVDGLLEMFEKEMEGSR